MIPPRRFSLGAPAGFGCQRLAMCRGSKAGPTHPGRYAANSSSPIFPFVSTPTSTSEPQTYNVNSASPIKMDWIRTGLNVLGLDRVFSGEESVPNPAESQAPSKMSIPPISSPSRLCRSHLTQRRVLQSQALQHSLQTPRCCLL